MKKFVVNSEIYEKENRVITTANKASNSEAGISKLYDDTGDNTDGTMTQSSISNKIKTLDENKVGLIPSTESTNVDFNNIRGIKDDNEVTALQFFKDKTLVAQVTDSTKVVEKNTNAISDIKDNITTNIYNLNDVVKGKWITDKNGSTGSSTSWAYLPLNVKGLKTVTISALGGTASWSKHYFNDSNGTTIAYNNSQVTASVPSDATILYVNIYEEFTDINAIKITTESVGEVVSDNTNNIVDINSNMSDYGLNNVFDGELVNGYHDWTNGNFVNNTTVVEVKNAISVNNGDTVSVKTERIFEYICCVLFNGETYVSGDYVQNNNEFTFMIPSGVNRVYVYFSNDATITPSTAGHIGVYINNQIDVVKNDVNVLKNDKDTLTADVAEINRNIDGLQNALDGKASNDHTHNYAGSSSAGGSANSSVIPYGFSNRAGSTNWGNQTGTYVTDWGDSTGGSIQFRSNNPASGQLSALIDGYFYQREGQNRCLDTSDSSSFASSSHTHTTADWAGKTDNRDYQMAFSLDSQYNFDSDSKFQYNPSSKTLKVKNIKATGDTNSTNYIVNDKVKIEFNSTTDSLDFNFL